MICTVNKFFVTDGDENAVHGTGEEQQGTQKTKKVTALYMYLFVYQTLMALGRG